MMEGNVCLSTGLNRLHRFVPAVARAVLLLSVGVSIAEAQVIATVSWDRNTDTYTAGYRVYYGTASGTYTSSVDTGTAISASISLDPGSIFYFVVRGYNTSGQYGPPSSEVFVDLRTAAPTAQISATLGANNVATVTWQTANAASATLNGNPVALSGTANFTISSTTTYTVRATAADGRFATASTTVTLDSTPPGVAVSSPASGSTVSGAVTVSATASDNVGVAGVQFLLDGVAQGAEDTTSPYAVSWTTTLSSNGAHTVAARARDAAGNATTSAAVPVTVANGSGSLTLTLPSIGADDGVLVESTETTNFAGLVDSASAAVGALRIGDLNNDAQLKSILSFDTTSIPAGATVLSARVRVRSGELRGTSPFLTHSAAQVDLRQGAFGSSRALEAGDFAVAPTAANVATLSAPAVIGDWSEGTLTAAGLAALNRSGVTQFRLAFSLDDDDDNTSDFVGYKGGDDPDPASRPQLIVTYSAGGTSNTAPVVTITGPANGTTVPQGTALTFSGTATDAQDGSLTAGLRWTSSRDGLLGTGAAFQRVLTAGTHTVTASVTDSGGLPATASISVTVTSSGSSISTTLVSIAADDGLVLETTESGNQGGFVDSTVAGLRMGDAANDAQYKSVLSFNTSGIPAGATILSATVRVRRETMRGSNPFVTHGAARVDIRTGAFGSGAGLEPGDFQAAPTAAGVAVLSAPATDGAWAEGSLTAAGLAALNRTGITQFRLAFERDDDDDATADFVGFRSGDDSDAASRPQLIVVYQP